MSVLQAKSGTAVFWIGALIAFPAIALAAGHLRHPARSADLGESEPAKKPRWVDWLTTDFGLATAFVTIAAAGLQAMTVMIVLASAAGNYQGAGNSTQLRVDAIKYGLGSIAAAGGAVALLLALRRQRTVEAGQRIAEENQLHANRVQTHAEAEAIHRRVTELFTKAVEQLGSDVAAIRLGSLYALERVAHEDRAQRQTIVDIICAYLRMPFEPPSDDDPAGTWQGHEIQVRLTAQRILARHLRIPPTSVDADGPDWPDVDLDLTEATLINGDFAGCRIRMATFANATFHGMTRFETSEFLGPVNFYGSKFQDAATFGQADFRRAAVFSHARFVGGGNFNRTIFEDEAHFDSVTFAAAVGFRGADFNNGAEFGETRFLGGVHFDKASFDGAVWFQGAAIGGSSALKTVLPHGWLVTPDRDNPLIGRVNEPPL